MNEEAIAAFVEFIDRKVQFEKYRAEIESPMATVTAAVDERAQISTGTSVVVGNGITIQNNGSLCTRAIIEDGVFRPAPSKVHLRKNPKRWGSSAEI